MSKWTANNIPDQSGKSFIITGGNSGIGFQAALVLASKNAEVVLAVRSLDKGAQAVAEIRRAYPQANVSATQLDLASLASVRQFTESFSASHKQLNALINNAGVMGIPYRKTVDGFEMQIGTNHLGHYALTGLLLPLILATPQARVVCVSSGMHMFGKIDFANLNAEKKYAPWAAYSQSKLANLLFVYELERRFKQANVNAIGLGCHPGYAATNLQFGAARMTRSSLSESMNKLANTLFAQSAAMGALPTLYATTATNLSGGEYVGPTGLGGMRGYPGIVRSSARSYDTTTAQELWRVSEQLTGIQFDLGKT